jgi:hypothetical protein
MNQFFSSKRFALLVKKHWADHKKRYSLSLFAFAGLLILWFLFTMLVIDDNDRMNSEVQMGTFFFALVTMGTFYASQYFRDLGSRPKGINFLLVPASSFEKILCSLLFTIVLFFVVFTATFYLVDVLMVTVANNFTMGNNSSQNAAVANVFEGVSLHFKLGYQVSFLPVFISVQSAYLLGSAYFKKYSFIKTNISLFIAWLVLFSLAVLFHDIIIPDDNDSDQLPDWLAISLILLAYVTAPLLWIVTYRTLKQKQV